MQSLEYDITLPEKIKLIEVPNSPVKFDILTHVPKDTWNELLSWLDGKSLVSVAKTCRRLSALAKNPILWKQICIRECPESDDPLFNRIECYLGCYQRYWQHVMFLLDEVY
jgi:hypothetical protein